MTKTQTSEMLRFTLMLILALLMGLLLIASGVAYLDERASIGGSAAATPILGLVTIAVGLLAFLNPFIYRVRRNPSLYRSIFYGSLGWFFFSLFVGLY